MANFEDMGLSAPLLRAVSEMGFEEPTPVQARAIPPLLAGHDVVAQALTGTGKTAAYGIPMTERLDPKLNWPQAIVLAPTRELAIQVSEHMAQLSRHRHLRFLAIYGGQPIERQLNALRRGVHGIVATPGRLMDHMRRGTVDLSEVRMLVLDEADQMLQMGFQEDVEYVAGHLPKDRLTALFSATMPQPILNIVKNYMTEPEMIMLSGPQQLTVPEVEQVFYQVPFPRKFDALCRVMDARSADRTMVFCATKRMVDEVAERLPAHGYAAEALHGDVSQAGREKVLRAFREGRTDVLVATDVAARGLDISDVGLVINFDIPPDPEYYVHRIGRTARSGRGGVAVTFVNPREMRELQVIERVTGARIRRGELPTAVEAEEREAEQLEERLLQILERGSGRRFRSIVEGIGAEHDPVEVAAAALAMAAERRGPRRSGQPAAPPPAPPAYERNAETERPRHRDDAGAPAPRHYASAQPRAQRQPSGVSTTRTKPRTFRGNGNSGKPDGRPPYKGKRKY